MNIDEIEIPQRHTFFQLNFFVINKEPTIQAKLKRCLDELKIRKETVESINLEIEDSEDHKKLLELKLEKLSSSPEDEINKRRITRKIKNLEIKNNKLKERLKGVVEEIEFFSKSFEKYNSKEKLKSWDDFDVQCEYWDAKLKDEINHRLMLGLPVDVEILKTALALPDKLETKKQIVAFLEKTFNNNLINKT